MPLRRDLPLEPPVETKVVKVSRDTTQHGQKRSESFARTDTPSKQPNETHSLRNNAIGYDGLNPRDPTTSKRELNRHMAAKLKIDLGNGPRASAGFNVPIAGSIATPSKTPNMSLQDKRITSTFDDTETIDFDDNSSHNVDSQTMVFRGNADAKIQHNSIDDLDYLGPEIIPSTLVHNLGPSWQQEVAEERIYLGWDVPEEENIFYPDQEQGGLEQQVMQQVNHVPASAQKSLSPSRTRAQPITRAVSHPIKNVTFVPSPATPSKELAEQWPPNMSASNQPPSASILNAALSTRPEKSDFGATAAQSSWKSHTGTLSKTSTKVDLALHPEKESSFPIKSGFEMSEPSDTTASSEDGLGQDGDGISAPHSPTQNQRNKKRNRDDNLDYDLPALQGMSFDQLLREQFTSDPQATSLSEGTKNGEPSMTDLDNQLESLDGSQLKSYFRSQSDQEWAMTGTWFVKKFADDLRKLMEARCERRKVSMQYEHEIRQQHQRVEKCVALVDSELQDLRKGGGELIQGRKSNGKPSD